MFSGNTKIHLQFLHLLVLLTNLHILFLPGKTAPWRLLVLIPRCLRIRCLDILDHFLIILFHLIIPLWVLFLHILLILQIYSQISHLTLRFL